MLGLNGALLMHALNTEGRTCGFWRIGGEPVVESCCSPSIDDDLFSEFYTGE